jgi:hypothetical protein
LAQVGLSGRFAVPTQVERIDHATLRRYEAGQPVVAPAVFGNAMSDLDGGPRTDTPGREPLQKDAASNPEWFNTTWAPSSATVQSRPCT